MSNMKLVLQLFTVFFKIGAFTFGGGLAMLPLIQKEVVDHRKWVNERDILDIFAVSQSVPGVIAINSGIFIGKRVAGTLGALSAAMGVILPAFLSILLVITILTSLKDNLIVQKVFTGIRAASAAMIMLAAIKLGKSAIKGKMGLVAAAVSFILIIVLDVHAMWAVILGAAYGVSMYLYSRRKV